ncbi:MAG: transposase [Deltaproteobacteria bacterium]|nr:transposase [Deltaproteobacteria bacterium]
MPDGVFYETDDGKLAFAKLDPPTDEEVQTLLCRIGRRIETIVELYQDACAPSDEDEAIGQTLVEAAQSAQQTRLPGGHYLPPADKPRCAHIDGFSLHADVAVTADDRRGLERLLRYGARPVLSQRRLSVTPSGQVAYKLKRSTFDGKRQITMAPEVFVRRLAALIPPPWFNLTRFHGVFAGHSKHRQRIAALVPKVEVLPGCC